MNEKLLIGLESKNTSINHIPLGIKKIVEWGMNSNNGMNLDYGAGKYYKSIEYLRNYGIINLPYDPGHYDFCHNKEVLKICKYIGGAKTGTMLNVLNVIPMKEERLESVFHFLEHLHREARAIIGVYEKNKDGKLEETKCGWQNNQPLEFYRDEIHENFPRVKIEEKEKFLILSFI